MVVKRDQLGYNGNPNLPKAGNKIQWTEEKIREYKKCMNDPVYFTKTYMKIVHIDDGVVPFNLYEFQEDAVNAYLTNRNMILCQSRQSGKTSVVTAIILHYCLFKKDKMVAILANKLDQALEIMERIQLAYEYLPDFLKGGVATWNKKSVKFGNGTKIMAAASSSSAIRGKSCSMVYIDEHAFIPRWEEFSASVLPVLSSGKESRLLLSSTPNGLNQFYTYMQAAKAGTNGFWWIEVPWYKVPGRDDAWKQKVLGDINHDLIKFAQEYELEFQGSSGTLINGSTLKRLKAVQAISSGSGISVYHPVEKNRLYVGLVDVSHGKGLDYSVVQMIDITEMPYKQVAKFRLNTITPVDLAVTAAQLGKYYNNAFLLVENNDIGAQVTYHLWHELEYENILSSTNKGRGGKILNLGVPAKSDIGIRMTKNVKALGCSVLKLLIEQDQLKIFDKDTIDELNTFSKKGSSYEAEEGKHDDCVMPLISFAWMTTTGLFKELTDTNAVKTMTDYQEDQLVRSILAAGIVNTGVEDIGQKKLVKLEGESGLWEEADWMGYTGMRIY
jgi:hypothetical protein